MVAKIAWCVYMICDDDVKVDKNFNLCFISGLLIKQLTKLVI